MTEINLTRKKEFMTKLTNEYRFVVDMGLWTGPFDEFLESVLKETIETTEISDPSENILPIFWKRVKKKMHEWAEKVSEEKDIGTLLWDYLESQKQEKPIDEVFTTKLNRLGLSLDVDFYIDLLGKHPEIIERIERLDEREREGLNYRNKSYQVLFYAYRLLKSSQEELKPEDFSLPFDDEYARKILSEESVRQYLKEIENYPTLNQKQIYEYAIREKNGDVEAKQRLIESHLKYVVVRTLHKCLETQETVTDFLEFVQEGNMGLIRAIESFQPERGYQFSSYAKYWIDRYVINALFSYQHPIKVTQYILSQKKKLEDTISQFEKEHQRRPSLVELAQKTNRSVKVTEDTLKVITQFTSLDDEKEIPLMETIESPYWSMEETEQKILLEEFDEVMKRLVTKRQYEVLKMLYKKNMEGESVGKQLGMSRQAVHQQELKGFRRLRRSREVQTYVEAMNHPVEALTYLYLCRLPQNERIRKEIEYTEKEYQEARKRAIEQFQWETQPLKKKPVVHKSSKKETSKSVTHLQIKTLTENATIRKENPGLVNRKERENLGQEETKPTYQKYLQK